MGCYPLFSCPDWSHLHADLEALEAAENGLVSLSLVTDPFGQYDQPYLRQCFRDVAIPFKRHYVVDLSKPLSAFVHPHHLRNASKSLRAVQVENCENPAQIADDWLLLYQNLIERHQIRGISAFSRQSLVKQLMVPGMQAFRAIHQGATVGITLWCVQQGVGYYHLGAYSDTGYKLKVSFSLFWTALERFAADGLMWLNLGAGAGLAGDETDGLSRFKRGWSTGTRTAYFCGRIFDQAKYSEIVKMKGSSPTNYFPLYRQGEFQ
jgi:hypothetical protein